MSYIACALAFGLFFVIKKFLPQRLSKLPYLQFVPFALLAIGTMTLADTRVGSWIAGAVDSVAGWAGGLVGVSGATLVTVAFVLLTVAALFDLVDGKVEGIARTGIIALPFLALVAVGPVSATAAELFTTVQQAGTQPLMTLIGR